VTESSEPEEPADEGEGGGGILGRTVGAILGTGPAAESTADGIHLNSATFEDLRELGFSVTQATRVITYRERQGGFASVDELAEVPGMPDELLSEVSPRLTL
jgi:competence protein ComEA